VRPDPRVVLALLALAALLATASPAAAHGADDHGATRPGVEAPPAELRALAQHAAESAPAGRSPLDQARAVDAHLIAEWHESHGHRQWNDGRGHWGHSWATYRVQARQLREYLLSQSEAVRRFALVMRWAKVADCESSGEWGIATGNGYYGGLQFSLSTWAAYGGAGRPDRQPAWYQAEVADRVRVRSGLHHWPVCGDYYRG